MGFTVSILSYRTILEIFSKKAIFAIGHLTMNEALMRIKCEYTSTRHSDGF